MRVLALFLELARTAAEQPIELVHQQVDRLVALSLDHRGVDVRPVDHEMTLGREALPRGLLRVALQFHPDADDPFLVAEQSLHLLHHVRFHGRGEVEVNSGDDYFVRLVSLVHGYFCFWIGHCALKGSGAPYSP